MAASSVGIRKSQKITLQERSLLGPGIPIGLAIPVINLVCKIPEGEN